MPKLRLIIFLAAAALFINPASGYPDGTNHIKELDSLRTSMSSLGSTMPERIRGAQKYDIRTLERVFEINTYALTTIEAYFKMIKVAVSSNGDINTEIVSVLNGWLEFMNKYCGKDLDYFDEAMAITTDKKVIDLITKARNNIQTLDSITKRAIKENNDMLKKSP